MVMVGYRQDNTAAEGTVQAHARVGTPVTQGVANINSAGEGIVAATQFSTAPYKPPKRRASDKAKPLCSQEDCKSYPMTDKPYCVHHARVHGLLRTCGQRECANIPSKGDDFCRWHKPKVVADELG